MRSGNDQGQHGGPIGGPIRSSNKPPLTSVNSKIGAPNDGAHTGTTSPQRNGKERMRWHDVAALHEQLSQRDLAILRSVADHHFMAVRQIEALHFAQHPPGTGGRLARRALARLRHLRILGALSRRVGGVRSGSAGMVHFVDVIGYQVLNEGSGRHARGFSEPSPRFVNHCLAIADAAVALVQADRAGELELAACDLEPGSWRRFTGLGGARLTLKPDLYVETAVVSNSDLVHAWFVEIDLGTESIPTLLKKCRDYEAYRQTGTEQADGSFPLVIWSVTHPDSAKAERRRQDLLTAIAADRVLPTALFRVVAPDQLLPLIRNGGSE